MAMAGLDFKESSTSLNVENFKKKNPKNSNNLKSFWAFLVSIFVYISVFYIFNLSPSTLLCTTKFWFFISNTLILIIAADFGAFSSSKEHDFYEEYVKSTIVPKAKSVPSTFEFQFQNTVSINDDHNKEEEEVDDEKPQEKIISVVSVSDHHHHNKHHEPDEKRHFLLPEKREDSVVVHDQEEEKLVEKSKQEAMGFESIYPEVRKKRETKCSRSNSDKGIFLTAAAAAASEENEEKKMVLQRTLSEGQEVEENEFSKMSDEELNRRVEDFIRKFNRQIRLQAARSRHERG